MNKIYKVIWSKAKNCYVVVSEMAKRNGKCSSSLNRKIIAFFLAAGLVAALPVGAEAATFNPGTGSGVADSARNNNAWGNRTVVLNYQFFRNGEPVYIIWDNGGDQKFRAIDSNGSAFSSGSTIDQLVNRLRSSEYSTVTWIDLGTKNSTAFGDRTTVSGEGATAFGFYTSATANQATAFGHRTTATANRATAFGIETAASGRNSTSFGYQTTSSGENATAWGSGTQAVGGGATAWGTNAEARAEASTAWGNGSVVHGGHMVGSTEAGGTVGREYFDVEVLIDNNTNTRYIEGTYYVKDAADQYILDDNGNKVTAKEIIKSGFTNDPTDGSVADPKTGRQKADQWIRDYGRLAGYNSTAFGKDSVVYAENALAALGGTVGQNDSNEGLNSAAIGVGAIVEASDAYAMGNGATVGTGSEGSVALGGQEGKQTKIGTGATNSFAAIGGTVGNSATNAIAVGGAVSASATSAIAIGNGSSAEIAGGVALGSDSVASTAASTTTVPVKGFDYSLGTSSDTDDVIWRPSRSAVSVGNAANNVTRQITGVAAGSADTDAVNVAQLKKVQWNVGISAFGGTDDYGNARGSLNILTTEGERDLDVNTAIVGYEKNKVKLIADTGMSLSATDISVGSSTSNGYGIILRPDLQALELTPDGKVEGIIYKGALKPISATSSTGSTNIITDRRAMSLSWQTINDVTYRKIDSPFININGIPGDDEYAVKTSEWAYARGADSVAIGKEANTGETAKEAIAIGHLAEATNINATAIGYKAHALAKNSVAFGTATFATGNRGIAIGTSSVLGDTPETDVHENHQRTWAAGQGSIALGNEARAVTETKRFSGLTDIDLNANDAIAIGTRADARAMNAIALGGNMSYTGREGNPPYYGGEGGNRDFGATVGEYAKSAISIGGAYGTQTDAVPEIKYEAAATYGAKSIAIGTGSIVADAEKFLDLKSVVNAQDFQEKRSEYYSARAEFTQAERDLNDFVNSNPEGTAIPDGLQTKYNDARIRLFGPDGVTGATKAFQDELAKKLELEKDNAESVQDAIAIGTGAQAQIAGAVAIGSDSNAGLLERAGTDSKLTGYDVRTRIGYSEVDSTSSVWRSTAASVSVGGGANPDTETPMVTRRISNVAAGVFDADAVNVAQLKRATNYESDNRNLFITENSDGAQQLSSPFIHVNGLDDATKEKIGIASYEKKDYIDTVKSEYRNLNERITGYEEALAEIEGKLGDESDANTLKGKLKKAKDAATAAGRDLDKDTLVQGYTALINDAEYEQSLLDAKYQLALKKKKEDFEDKYGADSNNATTGASNGLDEEKIGAVWQEAYNFVKAPDKNQLAHAYGEDSMAFGKNAKAYGQEAIVMGSSTVGEADIMGKGKQSIAIGAGNTVTGNNSIAVGTEHTIAGSRSGAFGDPSFVHADNSYSVGNNNYVGDGSNHSFAIGNSVEIKNAQDVFVLGSSVNIESEDASGSVFLGSGSGYMVADDNTTAGRDIYKDVKINGKSYTFANGDRIDGVVSVGGTTDDIQITRRIQNVAAGLISENSTDAINGSQLYAAMQALGGVTVIGDVKKSTEIKGTVTSKGGTGGTSITTPQTTYEVKANVTTVKAGDNITVTGPVEETADKPFEYTVSLNKDITIDSVTAGDPAGDSSKLDKNGLTITGGPNGNPVTINNKTVDMAGNKIESVGSGLGNAAYNNADDNNAANIGDVKELTTQVTVNDNETAENKNLVLTPTKTDYGRNVYDVKLSNNIDLTPNGSLDVGSSKLNDSGLTIKNSDPNKSDIKVSGDGISAGEQKITNVAPGTDPTDAVNVSQLQNYAAGNNQTINNLGSQITNVDSRARKGIAGAAALAALHPLEFDPDDKLTFAAGMGHYRGENAAALGLFYRPDEKVMFSLGGSLGNGENMINAGVSFSLDRTPRKTSSRTAMAREIVELREHVAKQDAQIAELTALVRQLAGNAGLQVPASSALPTESPALFADNLDNKWVYDAIEDLEQRGYFNGYAGRALTRQQIAAALDMAMSGGAKLDERIVKEFEPELSHVRVAHVEGKGNEEGEWYERPRASHDKYEDKHKIEKKPFRVEEKKVTSKS